MQEVGSHSCAPMALKSTVSLLAAFMSGCSLSAAFAGIQGTLSVDLSFLSLEAGSLLLTVPVSSAPVGTLRRGSNPTFPFCSALAEVLHEGSALQHTSAWTSRHFHTSSEI